MNDRIAGYAVLLTVGLGGLLFAPVFTFPVVVVAVAAALIAVAAGDEATRRVKRWRRVIRPTLSVLLGLFGTALFHTIMAGVPLAGSWQRLRWLAGEGWQVTLHTTWPADRELAGFVSLLCLAAAVAAVELVRDGRAALAILPGLMVAMLAQGFQPVGARETLAAAAAFCLLAMVVLVCARRGEDFELGRPARGGLGLARAGAAVGALVLAAAVGFIVDPVGRAPVSLREVVEAQRPTLAVVNPLDQIGDRLREPEKVVFRYRSPVTPPRWPLVVLEDFDGQRWTSAADYQRLGTTLVAAQDGRSTSEQTASVTLSQPIGPWLPTPGGVVAVSGLQPLVDRQTGMLMMPALGTSASAVSYDLTWRQSRLDVKDFNDRPFPAGGALASTPMDFPAEFSATLISAIGQEPPTVATALKLERYFRETFRLASGKQVPTGHGYAHLNQFLHETKRGTSEQFATAYVLLARAAGIPARLAVGFRQAGSPGVVRNGDVLAWPEIDVPGAGWLAVDPTAGAKTSAEVSGAAQAADQPLLPARQQVAETVVPDPVGSGSPNPPPARNGAGLPWRWLLAGLVAAVAVSLPFVVPASKGLRARRRRRGSDPQAVAGAWLEARDRLLDHGLTDAYSMTPSELAERAPVDAATRRRLEELSHLVSASLWSGRAVQRGAGRAAWATVRSMRSGLARRPPAERLRAAYSLRSLRASR